MMKKVALLTHSVANNYGANLQALSTASYLKNHGYEPIVLQWGSYLVGGTPSVQADIHKSFLKREGFIMSEPLEKDEDFTRFIDKERITKIIVGSDCVLTYAHHTFPFLLTRKGIVRIKRSEDYQFPNPFWLPFLEDSHDIKRCLLSASCGGGSSMKIKNASVHTRMISLLEKFNYISVRDSFTQSFVESMLPERKDIKLTPDPVFGFNNNVKNVPSEKDIRFKYNIQGEYYIVCFYKSNWPDQKWANKLMEEAHRQGVSCVSIPMPQGGRNSNFDLDIELPLDPLDWYALIKYSSGYIGNNMHPIIVALHNNVPFFSYNIHGRSLLHGRIQLIKTSKEYDLLSRFGLQRYLAPQPFLKFISPKSVIKLIQTFDKEKCGKASSFLQSEYDAMMTQIISKLEEV